VPASRPARTCCQSSPHAAVPPPVQAVPRLLASELLRACGQLWRSLRLRFPCTAGAAAHRFASASTAGMTTSCHGSASSLRRSTQSTTSPGTRRRTGRPRPEGSSASEGSKKPIAQAPSGDSHRVGCVLCCPRAGECPMNQSSLRICWKSCDPNEPRDLFSWQNRIGGGNRQQATIYN
jgi:hypothetical protein